MLAFGTREKQILINPFLPNGFNLLMVKLHMGSMYFYLQQAARRSMRVEAKMVINPVSKMGPMESPSIPNLQ